MYDVTIKSDNGARYTQTVIFSTPSINAALSCGQTLVDNGDITNWIWDKPRLYAMFYSTRYFDEPRY